MRAVKDFIMREIAGETILIPSGSAAKKFVRHIMFDMMRFIILCLQMCSDRLPQFMQMRARFQSC